MSFSERFNSLNILATFPLSLISVKNIYRKVICMEMLLYMYCIYLQAIIIHLPSILFVYIHLSLSGNPLLVNGLLCCEFIINLTTAERKLV